MPIAPTIKKNYLHKLAEQQKRADGRKFEEYRPVNIETGVISKAEGSARVKIGNTQVVAGIKMDMGEPYPDTPDSGVMTTAAELIPLASPDFEAGPPREDAIELARVVDRGIRESNVIELEKLCLTPGEKIWIVFIDAIPKYAEQQTSVIEAMQSKIPVLRPSAVRPCSDFIAIGVQSAAFLDQDRKQGSIVIMRRQKNRLNLLCECAGRHYARD